MGAVPISSPVDGWEIPFSCQSTATICFRMIGVGLQRDGDNCPLSAGAPSGPVNRKDASAVGSHD